MFFIHRSSRGWWVRRGRATSLDREITEGGGSPTTSGTPTSSRCWATVTSGGWWVTSPLPSTRCCPPSSSSRKPCSARKRLFYYCVFQMRSNNSGFRISHICVNIFFSVKVFDKLKHYFYNHHFLLIKV